MIHLTGRALLTVAALALLPAALAVAAFEVALTWPGGGSPNTSSARRRHRRPATHGGTL